MAAYLNQVQLIGNLGRDPEVHSTPGGSKVVNLSIATTDNWTDKRSGEKCERTEWHRIVIFSNGLANVVERYLQKGSKVFVQGSLQTRRWTDQDGKERYTTEIVLQPYTGKLIMLDGTQDRDTSHGDASHPTSGNNSASSSNGLDDVIPF